MNSDEIKQLLNGVIGPSCTRPKLIETHISWVILCDSFAYKIKKPIQYTFLDFSSIDKRLFFCREEIRLNWRLTFNVYLNVMEIRKQDDHIVLGGSEGDVIDYAVCMRTLDPKRQMNRLIIRNQVTLVDVQCVAAQLIRFHQKASIIKNKELHQIKAKFNDLLNEKDYVSKMINTKSGEIIETAVDISNKFLVKNAELMSNRLRDGFYRDVHGDLHTRNIFLLDKPIIFDCIEFNPDYRQIDILNEVAFLCMDLEAAGREDLSNSFLKYYVKHYPLEMGAPETSLFVFYKAYRANVRAKVNCLRAKELTNQDERKQVLNEIKKYLQLMDRYITTLSKSKISLSDH